MRNESDETKMENQICVKWW